MSLATLLLALAMVLVTCTPFRRRTTILALAAPGSDPGSQRITIVPTISVMPSERTLVKSPLVKQLFGVTVVCARAASPTTVSARTSAAAKPKNLFKFVISFCSPSFPLLSTRKNRPAPLQRAQTAKTTLQHPFRTIQHPQRIFFKKIFTPAFPPPPCRPQPLRNPCQPRQIRVRRAPNKQRTAGPRFARQGLGIGGQGIVAPQGFSRKRFQPQKGERAERMRSIFGGGTSKTSDPKRAQAIKAIKTCTKPFFSLHELRHA